MRARASEFSQGRFFSYSIALRFLFFTQTILVKCVCTLLSIFFYLSSRHAFLPTWGGVRDVTGQRTSALDANFREESKRLCFYNAVSYHGYVYYLWRRVGQLIMLAESGVNCVPFSVVCVGSFTIGIYPSTGDGARPVS